MEKSSDDNGAITAKIVAMCVLFTASMTLGILPIKLAQWLNWRSSAKNSIYVQMLLCFGGGVLLCTTFLHLLPEVAENFEKLDNFPQTTLPIPELLMCIGFFIMYCVEESVHTFLHRKEKRLHLRSVRNSILVSRGHVEETKSDIDSFPSENSHISHSHYHIDHSHVDHSHMVMEDSSIITLRGLLVVLALSVHELFEGLAVGLESSSATVWYMFGAVSAHKLVIAFCIGIELVTSGMKTILTMIYIFTFAIVSPMGIGIGIAISQKHESLTKIPSVILQGLACGTLLYVVFFEILREDRKSGIRQCLAVISGFIIMLCITLIESD